MHIPTGILGNILRRLFLWMTTVLGLGFSKYPIYVNSSDKNFDTLYIDQLLNFVNDAFGECYKPYTKSNIKEWIQSYPSMYVCVVDIIRLSTTPFKPRIVGCYKVVPLNENAVREIAEGKRFEIIDLSKNHIAPNLDSAQGIWVGDLRVISPMLSIDAIKLGRHLMEQIKLQLRSLNNNLPIFCRTERRDIQDFLMRRGFMPISDSGDDINGKTIFMLPPRERMRNLI